MSKRTTIISIIVFAVFIGAAVFAYNLLSDKVKPESNLTVTDKQGEVTQPQENIKDDKQKAPDFIMLDSNGNEVKLSDLFGKPIVLNFWASWCPPCKSEMPDFDKVYKELGNDITFVMVDMVDGQRETVAIGTKYVEEQGFSFPVYFDTKQSGASAHGIRSIPTTIFIDKDGYIVTGAQGAIDEAALRKGIELIK